MKKHKNKVRLKQVEPCFKNKILRLFLCQKCFEPETKNVKPFIQKSQNYFLAKSHKAFFKKFKSFFSKKSYKLFFQCFGLSVLIKKYFTFCEKFKTLEATKKYFDFIQIPQTFYTTKKYDKNDFGKVHLNAIKAHFTIEKT